MITIKWLLVSCAWLTAIAAILSKTNANISCIIIICSQIIIIFTIYKIKKMQKKEK